MGKEWFKTVGLFLIAAGLLAYVMTESFHKTEAAGVNFGAGRDDTLIMSIPKMDAKFVLRDPEAKTMCIYGTTRQGYLRLFAVRTYKYDLRFRDSSDRKYSREIETPNGLSVVRAKKLSAGYADDIEGKQNKK